MGNFISSYANNELKRENDNLISTNNRLTDLHKDYVNKILNLEDIISNSNSNIEIDFDYDQIFTINKNLEFDNLKLNEIITNLKNDIIQLTSEKETKQVNINKDFEKKLHESVSKMVDNILKNNDINTIIPDYIERKIYSNIFTILINLLKEVMEDANISILNQNIKLKMTPKDD